MSFIEEIIEAVDRAKELTDEEKHELVAIIQQAWDAEQENAVSESVRPCPKSLSEKCLEERTNLSES